MTDFPPNPPDPDSFRELTLWQVLGRVFNAPDATLRQFFREITLQDESTIPLNEDVRLPTRQELRQAQAISAEDEVPADIEPTSKEIFIEEPAPVSESAIPASLPIRESLAIGCGHFLAIGFAIIGGILLWNAAIDYKGGDVGSLNGAPVLFVLAGMTYLGVTIAAWIIQAAHPKPSVTLPGISRESDQPRPQPITWQTRLTAWVKNNLLRLLLIPAGISLANLAYSENVIYDISGTRVTDVIFTTSGAISWFAAILVWFAILTVDWDALWNLIQQMRSWRPRWSRPRLAWQHGVLLLIMLLAVYFRLHDLKAAPPEMTSDHIEKLLDAVRVHEGYHAIFFPNNGGREAFQMYYIGWLVELTGMDFSFTALKIATATEGLLTVFLGYWLGLAVMGQRERPLGVWLGLVFAALLAISSWHTMLSRLGLRIVLTPLTTLVLLLFLIRAMRLNRRLDFVLVGIILGAGMYFYQSNRMLPLLVIIGTVMAAGVYARDWKDGIRYALNLAAAGVIAIVIFLPMYRYGQEFPDDYWNRTRGRLFGENAFVRTDPLTGQQEEYQPSLSEQLDRFFDDFDTFEDNYKNALLMWSWKGDGAWISNGDSRPALDPLTNGLFLLGLLGWLILILRNWDITHLLIPIGILIMVLPSALTLAYTIENPSFTRASGTIPFVFLIAGYPLAQAAYQVQQLIPKRRTLGVLLGVVVIAPVILLAAPINYDNYFHTYRDGYARSWKPYEAFAAPMREFAQGEGSYGNAFMIAYPHWLDHRILGTVAGDIKWNNGLVNRQDLFAFIGLNDGTPYQYDPEKPLFFMYNQADAETSAWLHTLFPDGEERLVEVPGRSELNFLTFIAPPHQDWALLMAKQQSLGE